MSLDMSNPLDRLYLETIPCRPPGVADCTNGPTALWAELEAKRGIWSLASEATPEAGAA